MGEHQALTDAQFELLADKYVLWDRASREGPMDLRDYNARAAEALKVALALARANAPPPVDWEALEDEIADAISDSLDMDWSSSDGARAVIAFLRRRQSQDPRHQGEGGGE